MSGATIFACGACGFLFKSKRPTEPYIHRHYLNSDHAYLSSLAEEDAWIREDLRVARRILNRNFPRGGSILDVGCASGFFLESLGGSWDRHGLEVSQLAAQRARERSTIIVHQGHLESVAFEGNRFDVVTCFDVVEHLAKPVPLFQEFRRILKPGGWLLVGTGDAHSIGARAGGNRWTYLCLPEHLSFFSPRSLTTLLARSGFSRIQFTRIHHGIRNRSAVTAWLRAVGKHRAVSFFGEDIVRLKIFRQKTSEFLVPYFFDHMICIAR